MTKPILRCTALSLFTLLSLLGAPSPARAERHALYAEAFGRGGLWGLGYDYQIHPRFAVGGVVSYTPLPGLHLTSLSPYVGARLLRSW
jgi:hypothetical protein